MSSLIVKTRAITAINPHPNADRLEIAEVGGWSLVVQKGLYQVGNMGVFVPPDALLNRTLADQFGFTPYMAELPKNEPLRENYLRVKAARLRGEPSFGVFLSINKLTQLGYNIPNEEDVDCQELLDVKKWEPPVVEISAGKAGSQQGDVERENSQLHKYTSIENWRNYPDVFQPDERVIFTEKTHGQNCAVGLIQEANSETGEMEWVFAARSHNHRRKQYVVSTKNFNKERDLEFVDIVYSPTKEIGVGSIVQSKSNGKLWRIDHDTDRFFIGTQVVQTGLSILPPHPYEEVKTISRYWLPLEIEGVKELLQYVKDTEEQPVNIFGELYGPGIQNLHYGVENGKIEFRAFDISIGGRYVDYLYFAFMCDKFNVPRMPVLYDGLYSPEAVKEHTDGKTTIGGDHIREGIVIRPALERFEYNLGRVVLKSISADYLAMKGLTNAR